MPGIHGTPWTSGRELNFCLGGEKGGHAFAARLFSLPIGKSLMSTRQIGFDL